MRILAGIDEAGLGPTLGPLVTAAAALLVPDDWRPDTPWTLLAEAVADRWTRSETRPAVGDSKIIHRTGGGDALAHTLAVFSSLANSRPDYPVAVAELEALHPCYAPFPDASPLRGHADARHDASRRRLASALAAHGAEAAHLEAAAVPEPVLNRRFADGLNKNQVLLMETGRHLAALSEKYSDRPILAVVDKQGGRNDYLPFLGALFPGAWIDTIEAGAALSAYRLRRPGGIMEIRFAAKADRSSFPTALASLAAKYAREWAMARFNAWFGAQAPGLRPTAGYPEDARRWLDEIRRREAGRELFLELVIRSR